MADELNGRKVAFLVANEGVEQVELTDPWAAVEAAGGQPTLIAPEAGTVHGFNARERAGTFDATVAAADASVEDYDGLVLPGGVVNGDKLRASDAGVALVRAFVEAGKPVAAICHVGWVLVEADVVRGRQVTSWPSLKTDLRNAGADWVDQELVVDANGPNTLITSRMPADLPAFNRAIAETF